MASTGGDNAKLSSLFNKKKKGGVKSMNANVIAKEEANRPAPTPPVKAAPAPVKKSTNSPSIKPKSQSVNAMKGVAELTIGDKKDVDEKRDFQWAKQPKKYKNTAEEEGVARTWEEQEQRNKVAKRINLQSERAFPTLGVDATQAQLSNMKAPESKAVATKNVWASLHHDDDDE